MASLRRNPTVPRDRDVHDGESATPSPVPPGRIAEAGVERRPAEASIVRDTSVDTRATAGALAREVQGARVRLNAAIEASRRLRRSLETRHIRSGVYPSPLAGKGWVLLVAGRTDHSRRLFLQLLGGGFNVDLAAHSEDVASVGPLRRWVALVLDGVEGNEWMRTAIRVARSVPSLATLPIVVAHDGVVPADVRASCAAIVREWTGEDLANVVSGVRGRFASR